MRASSLAVAATALFVLRSATSATTCDRACLQEAITTSGFTK